MTNYTRGRSYEYRVIAKLRKQGFTIVQRSAGSHSVVDIWAVDTAKKIIKLVQCKSGKSAKRELGKIELPERGYYFLESEAV
ncbi:MAG: hypothetical protein ACRDF4_03870 [Rhabdochlamydiaceae bacterium]